MKLITKEILTQAELVDPLHNEQVAQAYFLTRGGTYRFEMVERVKGGIAYRDPEFPEALSVLAEEELVGLKVELMPTAGPDHGIADLPALLRWSEKNRAERQKAARKKP